MRKLLFESKWKLFALDFFRIIVGAVFIILGAWIFLRSGDLGGYRLSTGLFGNSLSVRNTEVWFQIGAFFPLAFGVYLVCYVIVSRRSWVKVYTDHIEGNPCNIGTIFSLPLREISSVSMAAREKMVIFQARGSSYKIRCAEFQQVFRLVDNMISQPKQETPETVRYCAGCGKALAANARFCPVCGTRNEV